MFNLTYTTKQEEVLTLNVKKPPIRLGPFTDGFGNHFDCRGYGMNDSGYWAWLCPISKLHPYYSDTSNTNYGLVSQEWKSYRLNIV